MRTAVAFALIGALAGAVAIPALAQPGPGGPPAVAMTIGGVHTGSASFTPGAIVIQGDKIVAIGSPKDVMAKLMPGTQNLNMVPQLRQVLRSLHIAPLAFDANTQRGADGPMREGPLCPGLSAVDALDPMAVGWKRAADAGIGASVFAPDAEAVLGGKAVLLNPGARLLGATLRREVALFGSIDRSAWSRPGHQPATRGQAVAAIKALFAAARDKTLAPTADVRTWRPDAETLRAVHEGKLPLALRVGTEGDVAVALALFADLKVRGILVCPTTALDGDIDLGAIAKAGVGVILDPLSTRDSERSLAVPGKLGKAEIPFAFSSRAPRTAEGAIFDQAALAVHCGLDPTHAWKALTVWPAQLYGQPSPELKANGPSTFAIYRGNPARFGAGIVEVNRGPLNVQRLFSKLMGR